MREIPWDKVSRYANFATKEDISRINVIQPLAVIVVEQDICLTTVSVNKDPRERKNLLQITHPCQIRLRILVDLNVLYVVAGDMLLVFVHPNHRLGTIKYNLVLLPCPTTQNPSLLPFPLPTHKPQMELHLESCVDIASRQGTLYLIVPSVMPGMGRSFPIRETATACR